MSLLYQRCILTTLSTLILLFTSWHMVSLGAEEVSFVDSGQRLGLANSQEVLLGDLNGDGATDAFVANNVNMASNVWFNDGAGLFLASTQSLPIHHGGYRGGAALGDVDGDGDLDVVAVGGAANYLGLNNGSGHFTIHQTFPAPEAGYTDAEMGDLDGDGDLDLVLARIDANQVWFNDGTGQFAKSEQALGSGWTNRTHLADMDGDGDLDLTTANGSTGSQVSKIWLNDGSGSFTEGADLFQGWSYDHAVADFDGDGDLDIFFSSWTLSNELWLNDGNANFTPNGQSLGENGHLSVGAADIDNDGHIDAFVGSNNEQKTWLYRNNGNGLFSTQPETVAETIFTSDIAIDDLDGDNDLDLFLGVFGQNQVWFNDDSPSLSPSTISTLQDLRDDLLPQTAVGRYYSSLYYSHLGELMAIGVAHPSIAFDSWDTLELWTPALSALISEQSSQRGARRSAVISQEMTDSAIRVIDAIEANASPRLREAIAHEEREINFDQLTGQSISQAWTTLNERAITELYLPMVVAEPVR